MDEFSPSHNGILPRRKPGPEKKENPRSEKVSVRLTKEEKAAGEAFCKKRGITEAKLLRFVYLTVINHAPNNQMAKIVDELLPLDDVNLSDNEKISIRERAKSTLRKSATVLLLILMGCAAAPMVLKFVYGFYEDGKKLFMQTDEQCLTYPGQIGCDVMQPQWWDRSPDKH